MWSALASQISITYHSFWNTFIHVSELPRVPFFLLLLLFPYFFFLPSLLPSLLLSHSRTFVCLLFLFPFIFLLLSFILLFLFLHPPPHIIHVLVVKISPLPSFLFLNIQYIHMIENSKDTKNILQNISLSSLFSSYWVTLSPKTTNKCYQFLMHWQILHIHV